MTRYILAIDAGGSKCDAALICDDGGLAGWGRCDIHHPESGRGRGGSGRSEQTVTAAIRHSLDGAPACDELHVVGRHRLPLECLPASRICRVFFHGVSEPDAALALAGETHGFVVVAGTGALVYGLSPDGRELYLDGLGPLLGDHGSGYQIGLQAVRAAACARWHTRRATTLETVIRDACAKHAGNPPRFSLVDYMLGPRDRAEIAALAVLVDGEARNGDAVARRILLDAADDIAETLRDAVDRLGMAREDAALVGTGSVAMHSGIYWQRLCDRLAEAAPRLRPIRTDRPQVMGMALHVAQGLPGLDLPAFRERLFRTTQDTGK